MKNFTLFIGRSPETVTLEVLRLYLIDSMPIAVRVV